MMAGHEPKVWISDRYSAQQKHGERHQTCLAHLARDAAFALAHGSDDWPFRFKLWLGAAFDLARGITGFAASTVARKKKELEKRLGALLASATGCDLARELPAKIGRARDQLLTFCDFPGEVDPTNNTSERKLRPCVIQRKVTNGYRAMWAAKAEADLRTTVDTARLKGANPFAIVLATVRTILYLAAFQASRRAPEFIHFREYLQAAGKSVKAAIIATARKLVVTLNAMLASGTDYRPAAVV